MEEQESLSSGVKQVIDIDEERQLRPYKLENFVGQSKIKNNLSTFIQAARLRQTSMDHILFYGPPGLGKTTLSNIIAAELGASIQVTSGPILSKVGDLAAVLTNLKPNDVLFIDEIHRLPPSVEEVLYSAMEDFRLDIIVGTGPAARTIKIDISPFTLVGATTRMGLLSNPLLDRFGILLRLEFYNDDELAKIIENCCKVHKFNITPDAALAIAKRSRGTPRIGIRLTKRVIDFSLVDQSNDIGLKEVEDVLRKMSIDTYGLDDRDLKYLQFIAEKYSGGPVGIETIVAALSEDRSSVEEIVEPFLLKEGFVEKTPRGRVLTPKALTHVMPAAH